MLVDEATGEVKWDVQAHSVRAWYYSMTYLAVSPDSRFVVSVGWHEEHWKLWDASSGTLHRVGATHDGKGACICVFEDGGKRLLQPGCPVVAHIAGRQEVGYRAGGIRAVAFSPCGERLATAGQDGAVILWDAQTGKAEHRMELSIENILGLHFLSFSADGARLASGDANRFIYVWATTGALLHTIPAAHDHFVSEVHFSTTQNRILASGGGDRVIRLWDIESGEIVRSIDGKRLAVFSPDGGTIATAFGSGSVDVLLVDTESGALRFRMVGHVAVVESLAFSDDGGKLASASYDGTCKVWDCSTGALLRTIIVGITTYGVYSVAWVRDTQRGEAFAMGHHPRLGAGSRVLALEVGVVRMILDQV